MRRPPAALLVLLLSSSLSAQTVNPNRQVTAPIITGIYPPGGSLGTTIEWTLTGRGFSKSKDLRGLGPGIQLIDFQAVGDTQAKATVQIASGAIPGFRELRVDGPDGISNLVLVRIDRLPQVLEVEPNDEPEKGQVIPVGSAVVGVLKNVDIDHYRDQGGTRPPRDPRPRIEAAGHLLHAGPHRVDRVGPRDRPGSGLAWRGDRDCRLGVTTIPEDGILVVQVRDNTYGGGDLASYRLRVDPAPYATGLFPLGGPRGKSVEVSLSGGSLESPRTRSILLPDSAGREFDLGEFPGKDGPILAPRRFVVGDEGEVNEPLSGSTETPMPVLSGQTINGRIDRPGEVDRYRLKVKKGDRLRLKVQAAELGSWIDSVLTIRSPKGETLAENDDEGPPNQNQGNRVNNLGLAEGSPDSVLDYTTSARIPSSSIEVDRPLSAKGGPEYGYRLALGRTRPEFSMSLLLGNPNAGVGANGQAVANARLAPGLMGVFNLRPGSVTPVNFLLKGEGTPGLILIQAEGLPPGVKVDPVKVDFSDPGKPNEPRVRSSAGSFVIRVEPYAEPGIGELTVVASSTPKGDKPINRVASAIIGLQGTNVGVQTLPITRTLSSFPIRIVGESKGLFVGPPSPPRLIGVASSGVLLQGDRLDLALEFDQSPIADPGFEFEALAEGVGLATNTVISSGQSTGDEEATSDVIVRVLASPKAAPGVYPIRIKAKFTGGRIEDEVVSVIVRRPMELRLRGDGLAIKPGGTAELRVSALARARMRRARSTSSWKVCRGGSS